jgi:hypothetical protein
LCHCNHNDDDDDDQMKFIFSHSAFIQMRKVELLCVILSHRDMDPARTKVTFWEHRVNCDTFCRLREKEKQGCLSVCCLFRSLSSHSFSLSFSLERRASSSPELCSLELRVSASVWTRQTSYL